MTIRLQDRPQRSRKTLNSPRTDIDTVAEFKAAAESYVADAMAMGLNVADVTVSWGGGSGATVSMAGGSATEYTTANACDDLGISGAKLKSSGWTAGSATYDTGNFKWKNISEGPNSKKPNKKMNAAFE